MLLTTTILEQIRSSSFHLDWASTFDEGRESMARRELADDADRNAVEDELRWVVTGAEGLNESQRRLKAGDGEILWARTRTGLVRTMKGQPDHVIVLFEEVAEA